MLVDLLPNGSLKVSFQYDRKIVQLIRAVPERRWLPDLKYWTIPPTSLRFLQQQAARTGIQLRVTSSVQDALHLGERRRDDLRELKRNTNPLALPTDTTPYPYQYSGIRFLEHALHTFKGALMADDMGLGKTFMALSIVALHERVQNVLVLAPASLKYTWAAEIEQHYPQLTYTVIDGAPTKRLAQWEEDTRIKICNYELLLRDVYPRVAEWDFVIADEATRLKNYRKTGLVKTKELDVDGQPIKRRYTTIVGRVKKLNRRYAVALSGAPVENKLEELWSIMDFCIPGILGDGWVFYQQHVVTDRWGGFIRYKGIDQVKERVEPYLIRRRKSEVLTDLPEKVYSDVRIELTSKEWTFYKAIQNQIRDEIEDNPKLNVANILTMMLRLKQAVDDPRLLDEHDTPSSKVATIRDIVDGAGDHRIVFFTQFSQFADLLGEELEAPVIAGHVSARKRQDIVEGFQRGGQPCLVSTDAGAYGLTLTAADIVVHIDQWWNPARLRQREDRLHRIGRPCEYCGRKTGGGVDTVCTDDASPDGKCHSNSVQVVSLMAQRTIDEYVRKIIHRKMELVKAILDDEIPDEASVKLDREELMALLGVENDD